MHKLSVSLAAMLFVLVTTLSSCEAIGSIFKAGIWTGVIGIALVVFLIIYLISRSRK
ncbi:MAG: phosphatidate cytidylyltransferase [Ferruginibacter sp.]